VCKDITHCFPCDKEGHLPGQMWNADNCTACTCSKGTTPIVCDGTLGAGRCAKDLNSLAQPWQSIYRQPCWYSHGIIIKYRYLTNEQVWAVFTVNLELCIRAMIMLSYKICFEPDLVMWDMKLTQWQVLSLPVQSPAMQYHTAWLIRTYCLKVNVACFQTLAATFQTTWCHIPEN